MLATVAGPLSSFSFASVLDQSADCVKLIGLDGTIQYMNGNGLCAMEIDDLCAVEGQRWAGMWPEEAAQAIDAAYISAAAGEVVRFRAFCPTAKGDPRWWDVTVSMVSNDEGHHAGYLSISRDITEHQRSRDALEIAAAEMKHRLKNTYMMVSSLLTGVARGDAGREAFAREMSSRLVAMSTAQALFTADEASCDIAELIPALLLPFGNTACPVVVDIPPHVMVSQGQADAIALVIGELTVNATKHGALAHGGAIHVRSSMGEDGLTVFWDERSTVPPQHHERSGGQGLKLMDRIVRARSGMMETNWTPSGVVVRLNFQPV